MEIQTLLLFILLISGRTQVNEIKAHFPVAFFHAVYIGSRWSALRIGWLHDIDEAWQ